jgi:enamine deaminase RidA (YjgF/YER057c/UK114 family)
VRAGDFVFLSGLVSRRGRDDQAVPGPVSTQVRTILDNANVLLKTAGLTFANVVTARVFLTDGSYFETMNDEYRKVFVSKPPARATAVTGLMGLDWSVEITLMATSGERDVLGPTVAPSLPLSAAIRTGPFVFLSGVLGNTDTNVSDVAAQTRETLTRIGRTLDTAGLTFADVVENTVYLPDLWQTAAVERVYGEFFSGELPARTVVGASLVTRAGLIEIMTTAVGR